MGNSMIDFEKKYHYSKEDVDTAHELVFLRLKTLRRIVEKFNKTVEQAQWVEQHRSEIRKLEMSDGSFLHGEEAEYAWQAFNNNDWTYLNGIAMCAKELGKELEEM